MPIGIPYFGFYAFILPQFTDGGNVCPIVPFVPRKELHMLFGFYRKLLKLRDKRDNGTTLNLHSKSFISSTQIFCKYLSNRSISNSIFRVVVSHSSVAGRKNLIYFFHLAVVLWMMNDCRFCQDSDTWYIDEMSL